MRRARALHAALVLVGACAAPQKAPWGAPATASVRARPGEVLSLAAPRSCAPLGEAAAFPRAADFVPPRGARPLATFVGPTELVRGPRLVLPIEPLRAALPEGFARALAQQQQEEELESAASLELDLDGDGARELVALVTTQDERGGGLLIALERSGASVRLRSSHAFEPRRHAVDGGPIRTCHAEYALAGSLRLGARSLVVVYEERGVGCAALVGGGFERVLHLIDLGRPGTAAIEVLVAHGRLGEAGAADLFDGAAFAFDPEEDGTEALLVRGVYLGVRGCGAGDEAFSTEELVWRLVSPSGEIRAYLDGETAPLLEGVVPPQLLCTRRAPCGAKPALGLPP